MGCCGTVQDSGEVSGRQGEKREELGWGLGAGAGERRWVLGGQHPQAG